MNKRYDYSHNSIEKNLEKRFAELIMMSEEGIEEAEQLIRKMEQESTLQRVLYHYESPKRYKEFLSLFEWLREYAEENGDIIEWVIEEDNSIVTIEYLTRNLSCFAEDYTAHTIWSKVFETDEKHH